jgi:hypothetical protein
MVVRLLASVLAGRTRPETPKCGNLLTASKHPRYLKRGNLLETSDSRDRCELISPVPSPELFLWTYDERQGRQQRGAVATWGVRSARRIGYPEIFSLTVQLYSREH